MSERIQRKRTKGYRMPEGAIYVGRITRWGNPFQVTGSSVIGRPWFTVTAHPLTAGVQPPQRFGDEVLYTSHSRRADAVAHSVELFLSYCAVRRRDDAEAFTAWLAPLRGHDLACWCPLEDKDGNRMPCHADVLLELANPGWTP